MGGKMRERGRKWFLSVNRRNKMERYRKGGREMELSRDGDISSGLRVSHLEKMMEGKADELDAGPAETHFPGMVNLSGTLCYMNSVLQVSVPLHISPYMLGLMARHSHQSHPSCPTWSESSISP
jgi:hypothetical protein